MAMAGPPKSHRQRAGRWLLQNKRALVTFVLGCLVGTFSNTRPTLFGGNTFGAQHRQSLVAPSGGVTTLQTIAKRPTSHVDSEGRHIVKQQLVDPFVVDRLAGISVATLLPDQRVEAHNHETMHEFFYILSGTGTIEFDGTSHTLEKGTFVHATPLQKHSFLADSSSTVEMMIVGVATDDGRGPR